jgi:hypothetical protein
MSNYKGILTKRIIDWFFSKYIFIPQLFPNFYLCMHAYYRTTLALPAPGENECW